MDAALNDMPISSAIFWLLLLSLVNAVKTLASCVATSDVLPVTPVSVLITANISVNDTPNCAAWPVTLGNACANCSNDVTPFFAVNCILS